jgi:hypothetical protein
MRLLKLIWSERIGFIGKYGFLLSAIFHLLEKRDGMPLPSGLKSYDNLLLVIQFEKLKQEKGDKLNLFWIAVLQ